MEDNESDNWKLDFLIQVSKEDKKIKWPFTMSNEYNLNKHKVMKISTEVRIRRWNWRTDEDSHCLMALTWTPEGKRKVGGPDNLAINCRKRKTRTGVEVLE